MNKKGLTLIELLSVIVIISILALIVIPRFLDTLDYSKGKINTAQEKSLKEAAKSYIVDNIDNDNLFNDNQTRVYLISLVNGGYIEGDTQNIITNKKINLNASYVLITRTGEMPNYKYNYQVRIFDNA